MMKTDQIETGMYPVMEQFYSVQGEGNWAGTPAYFLRLAGCDVGCTWCDVKESWTTDTYPILSPENILLDILKTEANLIVITGGEPAMYDLSSLVKKLKSAGLRVHIETSGVYQSDESWDWLCLSPKKFKSPLESMLSIADELKVIVLNKTDLDFAEANAKLVSPTCKLYLQAEWSRVDAVSGMIVDYIKKNPKWSISIQTHKYLNIR